VSRRLRDIAAQRRFQRSTTQSGIFRFTVEVNPLVKAAYTRAAKRSFIAAMRPIAQAKFQGIGAFIEHLHIHAH
jgi:hypothetical protein